MSCLYFLNKLTFVLLFQDLVSQVFTVRRKVKIEGLNNIV